MFNTTTEIILVLLAFALGYIARKYAEKTWPDDAAHVDAVATKYGESAAAPQRRSKR